jgi:CubicO group peptidase (beta-lactamase class C family)
MTATLVAMQVDRRKIRWDTTVEEALPELRDGMKPAYRAVTIEQLLQHRGGFATDADGKLWDRAWTQTGTPMEQRLDFVKGTLGLEPEAEPGTKYIYSNQGYAVAGVMLEKKLGVSWENLMRDQLFRPLMMTSSGFGVPGTIGVIDQPWGHKWTNGRLDPQQADNPPAIGPAGTVNGSIWDMARYVLFHLNGANGEGRLLSKESFARLHMPPPGQDYALGWSRQDRDWAKGFTLSHNGSNTLNFASFWLAPRIKFAAVICSNIGGDSGEKTCDETAQALIKKYAVVG